MGKDGFPPVLDACCGSRMFWFDKQDKRALYMDKREISPELHTNGHTFSVLPDIVGDFRDMPFPDNTFQAVIFDPPHGINNGETSFLSRRYGCLGKDWRDYLRRGFAECFRVLKPGGTLIFKWNDMRQPVAEVLKLTPERPLVGNRNRAGKTHWVVFLKGDNKSGGGIMSKMTDNDCRKCEYYMSSRGYGCCAAGDGRRVTMIRQDECHHNRVSRSRRRYAEGAGTAGYVRQVDFSKELSAEMKQAVRTAVEEYGDDEK